MNENVHEFADRLNRRKHQFPPLRLHRGCYVPFEPPGKPRRRTVREVIARFLSAFRDSQR